MGQNICIDVGKFIAAIAKKKFMEKHLCLLKRIPSKKASEKLLLFDFETDQSTNEHIINFAMAMYSNGEEVAFKGYNACESFCKFLFSDKHKGFAAVS